MGSVRIGGYVGGSTPKFHSFHHCDPLVPVYSHMADPRPQWLKDIQIFVVHCLLYSSIIACNHTE